MVFAFSTYELDDELYELRRAGQKVAVQPKVLDLLLLLVRERARVVTKKEIFESLWPDAVVGDASLARAAMEARRAIGDDDQQVIVTVRGRGLRFVAEVRERAASRPPAQAAPAAAGSTASTSERPYVGRGDVDAALRARLDAGTGALVWLSGESGIGKTRTADELARTARARGATVATTRCHEVPGAPAYWPWTQIARAVGVDAQLDADAAPDARFRAYDTLTRQLLARSRPGAPLVLVLDDLQWADERSIELLRFFASEIHDAPVLVLAVVRDTAIGEDARGRALGALMSDQPTHHIALRGLGDADVARLVEATTGARPDASLVDKLRDKSGGNPRYVEQLLRTDWATRALASPAREIKSSIDLQPGLVQSIARHVEALSPGCRALLTLGAVIGGEIDVPQLAAVAEETPQQVLDALEEAIKARVVIKRTMARYAFTHALVRDVLYKGMTPAERIGQHRKVADALVLHYGGALEQHLGEVARHLLRAAPGGDAVRAIEMATRAADAALARGSGREAVALFEHAIEALSYAPEDPTRAAALRARLEEARAVARENQRGGASR